MAGLSLHSISFAKPNATARNYNKDAEITARDAQLLTHLSMFM